MAMLFFTVPRSAASARVFPALVGGGAFRLTPSVSIIRRLTAGHGKMIHLPSRTRPLTSRPAVHHPWPTFKVFFGDQADEFGHFPEALPSQNTDDVGQSPEASPSPDEISHSPEASPFQKTDGVHQSPEGSPSQKASPSPKEESGIRGEGGFNTKKSGGDLADRVLVLETTITQGFKNVEDRFTEIRADLKAGRDDIKFYMTIFLSGISLVVSTVIGGLSIKSFYFDTPEKQQTQELLHGAVTLAEERLRKEIKTMRCEVHQLNGELKAIHGEMKGVFETLRSRWF